MKYEKRYEELLNLMRESEFEDHMLYYFLGALSTVISKHEENGKRTIPIKEVVRCLELAYESRKKK